ncbi:MAG: CARDB domain-containing protein, partial [Candidatus Thermoplasmatota archaeon]
MRIGIYGIIFLLVFASVLPMVSGTIAKPDLIVSRIEYYPSKISAGETFTLNATIENVGSAPVIGKFSVALLVMEKKVNETDIIGLSTGEEKNISFTWRPSSGGKFTIKVLADSNKEVIEENEENNEFSIDITVGGEVSLPDLVISEINYLPLSPKVGDYITIDVTIKNIGNALADAPFKVSSNVPRGKIHIINDSLEPNEEIKISDTFPALVSGEFSIKFFVDISYEVIESNETNNEKSITIIIEEEKLPDLIISSATFDPMKPKSGEEVTIKAKIENIGKEKVTTGFVVSFRLEIILIGYI